MTKPLCAVIFFAIVIATEIGLETDGKKSEVCYALAILMLAIAWYLSEVL